MPVTLKSKGDPVQSPYVWEAMDYDGRAIRITVTFDNTLRLITGITVERDAGCLYGHIYVGLGPDGHPESSPWAFEVAVGLQVLSAVVLQLLVTLGISTIENFLAQQITAGP